MIIDSHIHLWGDSVARADWLAGSGAEPLRREFTLADYAGASAAAGIDRAIVVTAEQSTAETERLVVECAGSPLVAGIVGWVDLRGDVAGAPLAGLVGIRHSVISEGPGWLDRPDVARGIAAFAAGGRVLELLIASRDLPAVTRCAAAHPGLAIVVDHLAAPPADAVGRAAWRDGVRLLAANENLRLKLSGDGADDASFDVALDAFGADRLMFGSDWPVSLLRTPLGDELGRMQRLVSSLSAAEREQLFSGTALRSYGLAA